jgi:hypothetical protein
MRPPSPKVIDNELKVAVTHVIPSNLGSIGQRIRSKSDLSDLAAFTGRTDVNYSELEGCQDPIDSNGTAENAEDWTWKWGKMPVRSNSNLHSLREEHLAAPKTSASLVDICNATRDAPKHLDSVDQSRFVVAPNKDFSSRPDESEYRDYFDRELYIDSTPEESPPADDIAGKLNVKGAASKSDTTAEKDTDIPIQDSRDVQIAVDGGNARDREMFESEEEELHNTASPVPAADSTFHPVEDSSPEHTLSLEDIPYDAISPEPAAGDFYDSDTDSYLSLSLDEGDNGDIGRYKYRKILVPSQEQLLHLGLHDGENEITFELEDSSPITAQLFVWSAFSKIVVIDIEGAIAVTKSNMGIFGIPMGQKTTVHSGVSKLLHSIIANGYKVLYIAQRKAFHTSSKLQLANITAAAGILSSNPLSQLPAGPIFQSPESLMRGFGAERTDLFKAAALRGLKSLFPAGHNPYSACFCTRMKDSIVFLRYGVIEGRIFIVNELGEISSFNLTFRRSFAELHDSLGVIFPPVAGETNTAFNIAWGNGNMSADNSSCQAGILPPTVQDAPKPARAAPVDEFSDFLFWRPQPQFILS